MVRRDEVVDTILLNYWKDYNLEKRFNRTTFSENQEIWL